MHKLQKQNLEGALITEEQTCILLNVGRTKAREIAKEARAERKIGRCYRVNKKILLDYIEKVYSV